MNGRFGQLILFVIAIVVINVVAQLLGLQLRISIIGSIVLTLVLGGVMALGNRKS